ILRLVCVILDRREVVRSKLLSQTFGVFRDNHYAQILRVQVLSYGAVHIVESESLQLLSHKRSELAGTVISAVESVAYLLILTRGHHEDVLHQVVLHRIEILLRHALIDQLLEFMNSYAERHLRIGRNDGADPDFEDLRASRDVRIGEELEHSSRKGFDVCIVAVVHAAYFAYALIEVAHRRAMLAEPSARKPQSREVGMRARHFDRETERYGRRHSVFLNYFDLYPLRTVPDYASMQCRSGTFGKSRKLVLQLRDELVGNVSRYSDHYIRPRVGGTYEVLHIVERYR